MRCEWAQPSGSAMQSYHDDEWGVASRDDVHLFEMLTLEGAQAGLSWSTILNKREGYRSAFAGFDAERVAGFGPRDVERLMIDASIVRNRLKIESTIANARAIVALDGSLADLLWGYVGGEPVVNQWTSMDELPAKTSVSAAMSKGLKAAGFRFVGPTTCYSLMQAAGLVNDHLISCAYR